VDEGRLALGESFVRHIDQCLDCRACETACPAGVEYGKLVEAARAQIEQNYRRPFSSRIARSLVYRHLLPYPRRIASVARLARFYQNSGLRTVARASGLLHLLGLADREKLMPTVEKEFFFSRLGQTFAAQGKRRARVALFAGCISQVSFAALHQATIRVLAANGCEVVVPEGQLCCGALAAHAGVRDIARQLARANLDVFLRED
jgi:glycolate oxidase iron-sulfur subunit